MTAQMVQPVASDPVIVAGAQKGVLAIEEVELASQDSLVDRVEDIVLEVKAAARLRTISPAFELEEHPIDEAPPLKVVVIGAGLAGITAGILLPAKVPGIELTILERNSDIGGVWHNNIYPGVRCDIPSDVYQSTFAPSTHWSDNYAKGAEIKAYWKNLATKHGVDKLVKLNTRVLRAEWSEARGLWLIETTSNLPGEQATTTIEEANFFINATGMFSDPKFPDYPGIKEYAGHLSHTSAWDKEFDPAGKKIAVIGNGASGLQVVPQLQKSAAVLHHYARSRTWIAGSFGGEELDRDVRAHPPTDAEGYINHRRSLERNLFSTFGIFMKEEGKEQAARDRFVKIMSERLGDRVDLLEQILPEFSVSCRRLTPGPGYLEALREPNVSYITQKIRNFTKTGLQLVDGSEQDYDAIVCSTGGNVSFAPMFPVIAHGINLQDAWSPSGSPGFPDTYLGLAVPNFPNLFLVLGPGSSGPSGTVPNVAENQVTYIAKVLRKAHQQGIRSMTPTQEATNDYRAVCESFFPRTVVADNCSSWYNSGVAGGRVNALWPGSGTHANIARREIRAEDYSYTYNNKSGNRFAWLGNGWSKRDVQVARGDGDKLDLTPYLKQESVDGSIDLRYLHEAWFDV